MAAIREGLHAALTATALSCVLLAAAGGCGRQDPGAEASHSCQAVAVACPFRITCTEDAECPTDNVCDAERSYTDPKSACPKVVCQPLCSPDVVPPCAIGSRCLPDGHCQIIPCDDPESTPCPTHFRCDPAAAPDEPGRVDGSDVNSGYEDPKDIARGCVRLRCDEPDGHVCLPNWECTPDTATDASGCYAVPCTESGECLDDQHICEPTSDGSRPDGTDSFGCVLKNCEEGHSCAHVVEGVDIGICDLDAPTADTYGCTVRPCDDETPCGSGVCDPTSAAANVLGCRPKSCPEEATCTPDQTCMPNPTDPIHGTCGYPPVTGGSAGMAGTAAAAGMSGTGGVASNGGTGGQSVSGGMSSDGCGTD